MNSLNDLIQSHEMYDPQAVQHASYTAAPAPDQTPPPIDAYEPRPQYIEPEPVPQYHQPMQHYPAVQPQYMERQSPYAAQDRQTIESMMREISLMQRRLDIMMSSCQAMMERTHIMHEYHHIARYQSARQQMPYERTYTPAPQMHPMHHAEQPAPAPYYHQVPQQPTATTQPKKEAPLSIKEGVFDGANMISADGDMYAIPTSFLCSESLIEGDIMQAMIFASGQIQYKVSEPTTRENIMGILSTHAANSPHYIVQTANKAYKVLKEAVETAGATPGNQVLLTVPAGGESEWAAIAQVFSA